jgi:DNA-binding MarR family transcriptional regulator
MASERGVPARRDGKARRTPGAAGDPPGEPPALALETFLPYRLVDLASRMSRALGAHYGARFDLTIPEWRIVAVLGRFGPMSAGVVAERTSMDKPKVTRALQRLAAAGRITRTADPDDRRSVAIALTRTGHRLFDDVGRLALAWERDLVSALAPDDLRALFAALDTLSQQLAARPLPEA